MAAPPVLIVVDMQNGFVNHNSEHVVPPVLRLVEEWRGDIVFTRFFNLPGSSYERLIGWRRMQAAPETDLIPALESCASAIVDKHEYTFFNEAGRSLAARRGWRDFYICGIATDGCVLKTAVDAFELGYTPFVIEDACGSHAGSQAHEAGIYLAGRFIGRRQIIQTADVLDGFSGYASAGGD